MNYSVLDYLENCALQYPDKRAAVDENLALTWSALRDTSRRIGTSLLKKIKRGEPVVVYMEKSVQTLAVFFGSVYAGGCYSLMNTELPASRISHIRDVLCPHVVVTSDELIDAARDIFNGCDIYTASELAACEINDGALGERHRSAIDTDPLYINFTSGSTGIPKGIAVCHRSVIDFIEHFCSEFGITESDVIANQAPFDFDVSVKDIYSALKTGAELVIVPRRMFSSPVELIDFLCDHKVTTMIWAVSALCLISTFHGLDYKTPKTVNKILFSGEVMPYKHLMTWRSHLPEAMMVNLYGPTEITCNCTYHVLEEGRDYSAGIPIGRPFANEDVFLLDEENKKIESAETVGEICVRGTALALGYYCSPEQTAAHFVQNPLNPYYPDIIYRTGDLAMYNEGGELVFCGRKDFQIKYMGHRIELEEIERAMSSIDGVERCCCIFDEKKSKLKGYYVGTIDKATLHSTMKESLPIFMVPGVIRQVESMPLTKNGKIDRKQLEAEAMKKK